MTISMDVLLKYKAENLVETGTYQGATIKKALEIGFNEIYSIEVDSKKQEINKAKFKSLNNVHLFTGDSSSELKKILPLKGSVTIWLDAHYMGRPGIGVGYAAFPIIKELDLIKSLQKDCTILIDDVRLFGKWGVSEDKVVKYLMEINENYKIAKEDGHTKDDILVAKL